MTEYKAELISGQMTPIYVYVSTPVPVTQFVAVKGPVDVEFSLFGWTQLLFFGIFLALLKEKTRRRKP